MVFKKFLIYFKESLFKSVIATLLFIVVYQFSHLEIIRANIEDISFDLLNKFSIENKGQETQSPNVILFKVDDLYLKEKKLLDDNNNTNYGYLFPRDQIADFIENLDTTIETFESKNRPSMLFIDYDFSYTSLPYNKKLSKEDIKLVSVLEKERPYKIFLPKTSQYNFIEQLENPKIQDLIKDEKLVFVSVGVVESSDTISRRYYPIQNFKKSQEEKEYIQAVVALWQSHHLGRLNPKEVNTYFTRDNDIENRIIFKNYEEKINETEYESFFSYWKKLSVFSANYPLDEIIEENFSNAIILLGSTHSNSEDSFNVSAVKDTNTLSGIEIHANALMTLFYFDGKLEKFSFYKSVLIIFILFLLVNLIIELFFDLLNLHERRSLEFIVLLVVLTGVMFFISTYILIHYQQWFNWFIPVILFEAIEVIEFLKKYIVENYQKIKEREKDENINTSS